MNIARNGFAAPTRLVKPMTTLGSWRWSSRIVTRARYVSNTGEVKRSFAIEGSVCFTSGRATAWAALRPTPAVAREFPTSNNDAYTMATGPMNADRYGRAKAPMLYEPPWRMPNARCTGVPAMLQIADHLLGDVGEEGQQGQAEQGRNDLELVEGRGQRARQGDAQHDLGQHREVLSLHPAQPLHAEADSHDEDQRQRLGEDGPHTADLALTQVVGAGIGGFILTRSAPVVRGWSFGWRR